MNHKVPESKLARAKVASVAAVKVGIGKLGHEAKRPFLSNKDKKKNKQQLDERNAKILFNALTQLRGTALKVAQMISMEMDLLPRAYRKELQKSFHQVPPLNRVLIRKVMLQEFKQPPETLYTKFNAQAFAAASLGQVHKAQLPDGTGVAVKVQYPGINIAIESDLTLMRGMVRRMSNSKLFLQSLTEIETRLKEEVDYRIEARNTQWFQQHITLHGISVPQVYPDWSSQRVLTTEYASGLHLDAWLATNPDQEKRNQLAQLLYDFFIHSSRELQCLHADPNPGNYLFQEDGTITVIDFGCVRHLSDRFTDTFPRILNAYLDDEPDALFSAYADIGMSYKGLGDSLYEEILRPFGQWVTLPFQTDSFDFAKHSDYTQQGKAPMKRLSELSGLDYVAEEFVFHNRTIYGLYQIFERMGATINLRHHWVKS